MTFWWWYFANNTSSSSPLFPVLTCPLSKRTGFVSWQHTFILRSHLFDVSCKLGYACVYGNEGFTSCRSLSIGCYATSPSAMILSPDLLGDSPTKTGIFPPHSLHPPLKLFWCSEHSHYKMYVYLWNLLCLWNNVVCEHFHDKTFKLVAFKNDLSPSMTQLHINIDLVFCHIWDYLPGPGCRKSLPQTLALAPDIWLRAGFTPVRWWSCCSSSACSSGGPNE